MLCILHFESTNIFYFIFFFFVSFEFSTILHLSADSRNDNEVHKKNKWNCCGHMIVYTNCGVSVAVDKTLISAYIKLYKCINSGTTIGRRKCPHTHYTKIFFFRKSALKLCSTYDAVYRLRAIATLKDYKKKKK